MDDHAKPPRRLTDVPVLADLEPEITRKGRRRRAGAAATPDPGDGFGVFAYTEVRGFVDQLTDDLDRVAPGGRAAAAGLRGDHRRIRSGGPTDGAPADRGRPSAARQVADSPDRRGSRPSAAPRRRRPVVHRAGARVRAGGGERGLRLWPPATPARSAGRREHRDPWLELGRRPVRRRSAREDASGRRHRRRAGRGHPLPGPEQPAVPAVRRHPPDDDPRPRGPLPTARHRLRSVPPTQRGDPAAHPDRCDPGRSVRRRTDADRGRRVPGRRRAGSQVDGDLR